MTPLRFSVPLPPNRANARAHWSEVHRQRKSYGEALTAISMTGISYQYPGRTDFSIPPPPPEPHPHVRVRATLHVWAPMDEGNALNRLKWLEDWIVRAGYVVDDSPEHWTWDGIPGQVVDRKRQRVELTLTPEPRIVA